MGDLRIMKMNSGGPGFSFQVLNKQSIPCTLAIKTKKFGFRQTELIDVPEC